MAASFQLTAELVLTGPKNTAQVAQQLSKLQVPANVATSFDKLNRSVAKVRKTTQNLAQTTQNLGKSFGSVKTGANQAATSVQKVRGNTVQAVSAMENFGRTVGFVTTRLIGFRIASGLVIGFGGAIRGAVGEAIDFERQLVKVAQVTDREVSQLGRLTAEITRLSIAFGVSSKELITTSKTLSQAGLSARDTRIALEALAKSTLLPTFGDLNQTVEGSIAILNQFQLEARDLEKVLLAIDAVTGKLAVEASDVTTAVRKAGGIFATLNRDVDNGVESFKEFLAIFASVRQTTRESAQNIAVGLRNIFARIQRPRTVQFLREFGVELEATGDRAGELLKPLEVLDKLSEAFGDIGGRNVNIGQIVEQLGGVRQVGKVLPLLFQQELRQRALREATVDQTEAEQKLNKALETLSVRISQVREEFKAFIRELVGSDTFQIVAGGVLRLTSLLIDLAGAIKPILPFLTLFAGVKAFGAAATFGRGFRSGILNNPLAGAAGGVAVGARSAQTAQASVQSRSIDRNTTALSLLTRQLQSMTFSGRGGTGGFLGRHGQSVIVGGGGGGGGRRARRQRQFGFGNTRGLRNLPGRVNRFIGGNATSVSLLGAFAGGAVAQGLGTRTSTRAGLGGFAAGAGGGAALGSLGFGVPGAIVGSLIGGLVGATSALKDFEQKLQQTRIDDATESLEDTFAKFDKGIIDLNEANVEIINKTREIRRQLESRFLDRQQISNLRGGPSVVPILETGRATPTTAEIQEFGKQAQQAFRPFENELLTNLRAEFRRGTELEDLPIDILTNIGIAFGDIDAAAKESGGSLQEFFSVLNQSVIDLVQEQQKIALVAQAVERLDIQLDFARDNFRRFSASLEAINDVVGRGALASGQTALQRAQGRNVIGASFQPNVFSNVGGFSRETISSELQRVGIGGETAALVRLGRDLPNALRQISAQVAGATPTDIRTQFELLLSNALPNNAQFLNLFSEKLDALEDLSAEEIFEELQKELPPAVKAATDAAKLWTDVFNQSAQDLRTATDQRIAIDLQLATAQSSLRSTTVDLTQQLAQAISGQNLSLSQRVAAGRAGVQSLAGTTNAREIAARIGQLQQQRGALSGLPINPANEARRQAIETELGRNTLALQQVAEGALGLSEVMRELTIIQQQREATQRKIQDTALQGPEQRLETIRGLQELIRFQQGGALTQAGLRAGQQQVSFLQSTGQTALAQRLNTQLTRGIPGAGILGGGIGIQGRGEGRRERGLAGLGQQLLGDQLFAKAVELQERREQANRLTAENERAFLERRAQLDQAQQASFQLFADTTEQLATTLNNASVDLTLNVPQPIPLVLQGQQELSQAITEAVAKRVRIELLKVLPNPTDL